MESEIKIDFLERLTNKKVIVALLLLIILIFFWDYIWLKFDDKIVNKVFSKVEHPHWALDWLHITVVFITLIISFYLFINNKKVSTEAFTIATFFVILYGYWRFVSNHYDFVSITFIPNHKHLDLIILFYISIFSLKIKSWLKPNEEPFYYDDPFLIDKPITESQRDDFGRKRFAKEISYKLQSKLEDNDAGALAVGINGVWGSGKTSFTNLIKGYIETNNRIVLDFKPWSSTGPLRIIEDFFEQLVLEMEKYDPKLSKKIHEYANTLTSIDENSLTKFIGTVSNIIYNGNSRSYDEINTSIGKLKKQVIIFIDDLDRLDKKEIIEVLRLIRNTANFNNVVYVATYDKDYVEEAIQEFNPHNYKSFLEKIFQFEFTLPKYEKAILRKNLKNALTKALGDSYNSIIESAVEARTIAGRSLTNELIRTQRDVIRLSNALAFEFSLSIDEVHFVDLYLLQLLKLKFQSLYDYLYEYQTVFFLEHV